MTSLNYDIQEKLKNLNVFEKIIGVNIIIYAIGFILRITQNLPKGTSLSWLELPKDFFDVLVKPWSIFTYGFAHYDFIHILFNLLWLYFISRIILNLFNVKQALNIYFLGILAGALSYLLVYNIFPNESTKAIGSLVGASAGIRALLIFLCAYMPNRDVSLLTFKIKLWYIGAAIVAIDVLGLLGGNQGGNVAHLGGSLLGYLYATQLLKGKDIGKGFERFMDSITTVFKRSSPLKTVHKNKKKSFVGHTKTDFSEFNKQKRIDLILDKISKSGYESLTKEEKAFLFKAGKD